MEFAVFIVCGNRGTGKTLFASHYAIEYRNYYKKNRIIGNYNLNKIKNFEYNDKLFLNWSNISDCLIIIDDIASISNFDNFVKIILNESRKSKLHIILTGQYIKMFKPIIRTLAEFEVSCQYSKSKDILYFVLVNLNDNIFRFKIRNAVKIAKPYYDTREKVKRLSETELIDKCYEASNTLTDFEMNMSLYLTKQVVRSNIGKAKKEKWF